MIHRKKSENKLLITNLMYAIFYYKKYYRINLNNDEKKY